MRVYAVADIHGRNDRFDRIQNNLSNFISFMTHQPSTKAMAIPRLNPPILNKLVVLCLKKLLRKNLNIFMAGNCFTNFNIIVFFPRDYLSVQQLNGPVGKSGIAIAVRDHHNGCTFSV